MKLVNKDFWRAAADFYEVYGVDIKSLSAREISGLVIELPPSARLMGGIGIQSNTDMENLVSRNFYYSWGKNPRKQDFFKSKEHEPVKTAPLVPITKQVDIIELAKKKKRENAEQ